jgi:pimeloyl-ACP methyl ester carboxylesterase
MQKEQQWTWRDHSLAFEYDEGKSGDPIVYLHGLASDRHGEKVRHLRDWAARQGLPFLCFDHLGHGASSGTIGEITFGEWVASTTDLCDYVFGPSRPVWLVGSSMGGWVAQHAVAVRPSVRGLVTIAAAPGFPARMLNNLSKEAQQCYEEEDRVAWTIGEDVLWFQRKFFEEAAEWDRPLGRLWQGWEGSYLMVHGAKDDVVPLSTGLQALSERPEHTLLCVVGDGDHRLSRPSDMAIWTDWLTKKLT